MPTYHHAHDDTQRATIVAPDLDDFAAYVAPALSRPQRLQILEGIMACPHGLVRVLLNPDWDSCDPYTGCPTRYTVDSIDSLPRGLHDVLLATGRIKNDTYAERSAWRRALGCQRAAGKGH